MASWSENQTKHDVQYEKRVLMTALILREVYNGDLTYDRLDEITPSYHNYAKNDAISYLLKHGFIERVDGGYSLAKVII